jgi:hypothetical protein
MCISLSLSLSLSLPTSPLLLNFHLQGCSRLLVPKDMHRTLLVRMRRPNLDRQQRKRIYQDVVEEAKRKSSGVLPCVWCKENNGPVKKVGLRLVHERYKGPKFADDFGMFKDTFAYALQHTPELAQHLPRAQDDLHPLRVLELFRAMSPDVRSHSLELSNSLSVCLSVYLRVLCLCLVSVSV